MEGVGDVVVVMVWDVLGRWDAGSSGWWSMGMLVRVVSSEGVRAWRLEV